MRILFDDDHGRRVAMECSSVAAIPDSDGWAVVGTEMGNDQGVIIHTGLDERVAKNIVRRLFDFGSCVHDVS